MKTKQELAEERSWNEYVLKGPIPHSRTLYAHGFENGYTAALAKSSGLVEALIVASNQLEGISMAIREHGQNIDPEFFIESYQRFAAQARTALKEFRDA